jgi:oligopeptidase B
MRMLLKLLILLCLTMTAPVAKSPKPPIAAKKTKEIITHGDKRIDDYFWLREKTNKEVIAYLKAENKYADQVMRGTEKFQKILYKEILGHLKETDQSAPVRHGDFYYYSRTEKGKDYAIHCRKKGSLEAPEEVILNVNRLAKGHDFFSVGAFAISDDNRLLAYSTDSTGYRQYTLHVKNLETGKLLDEAFERVGSVEWAPDNQTLFFSTEHAVTKRSDEIHRHRVGEKEAPQIYFEPDELYDVYVERSRDKAYLFVISESKLSTEVRSLELKNPGGDFRLVETRRPDHKYYVTHANGKFFIRTNDKAKNYRVATADPSNPSLANWTEFIPHNPAIKIDDIDLFAKHLVVSERENGLERIRVIHLKSNEGHTIDLPEPAYDLSVAENPQFNTATLRFRYESMVTPSSVFDYDMNSRERTLIKQTEVPGYESKHYIAERVFATGKDGTKIPCSIVYKKGFEKRGTAPCFLYAYGSYGISMPAGFGFTRLALLDRGFVFVIAHIRGGGELGEPWRETGRMMQKQNTFDDFIACAEFLIREKYTSADRLAIEGGSAGGLLMGAVVNQRPDLFKAVIAQVPFVDVLNTMLDASLPLTTSEYIEWGNPNEKAAYDYMKTYSPYDNVKAQNYPAMLVRTSLNDSQVPYWEGAKFVAKIRALKTDSNDLLLKTNMGAGHGGASGRYEHLHDIAFDYAFIFKELGILKDNADDVFEYLSKK